MIHIDNDISLEKISLNYLDDMHEYSNNKEFKEALNIKEDYLKEDVQVFLEHLLEEEKSGKRDYYFIIKRGKAIGTIGFLMIQNSSAELGFAIAQEYWGSNIAKKCLDKIREIGFNDKLFEDLVIGTSITNIRTQRFALKNGFSEQKRTNTHIYFVQYRSLS